MAMPAAADKTVPKISAPRQASKMADSMDIQTEVRINRRGAPIVRSSRRSFSLSLARTKPVSSAAASEVATELAAKALSAEAAAEKTGVSPAAAGTVKEETVTDKE